MLVPLWIAAVARSRSMLWMTASTRFASAGPPPRRIVVRPMCDCEPTPAARCWSPQLRSPRSGSPSGSRQVRRPPPTHADRHHRRSPASVRWWHRVRLRSLCRVIRRHDSRRWRWRPGCRSIRGTTGAPICRRKGRSHPRLSSSCSSTTPRVEQRRARSASRHPLQPTRVSRPDRRSAGPTSATTSSSARTVRSGRVALARSPARWSPTRTGGNQGYAQLICLIGNFMTDAPTAAAQESLTRLTLFLADRYSIDTDTARR